ncbi:hypothetical protein H0N96_00990 [Candidatus Micrarchaeota archaeon]|nr:hypothetical protein [Candidatus Micrarchaeota archaeon]
MEKKGFIAVLLLLASALFFAGCVQTQPGKPTPVPTASPTIGPVACTQDAYVSCPDGFKYLKAQCVNGKLEDILYLVNPCDNHQSTPSPTQEPWPTSVPTASPTVVPTVTPSPSSCTQNVTKTCQNSAKTYLDSLCENGVLTKISYVIDPCSVMPSPTACTSDSYTTCQGGRTYLSASCIDGVQYQVSYFRDPCA